MWRGQAEHAWYYRLMLTMVFPPLLSYFPLFLKSLVLRSVGRESSTCCMVHGYRGPAAAGSVVPVACGLQ